MKNYLSNNLPRKISRQAPITLTISVPMILLALLNLKLLFRKVVEQKRTTYAILLLAAFLVLSHIAMIFGMVDPGIAGYKPKAKAVFEVQPPAHHMDSMHEGHHHHH